LQAAIILSGAFLLSRVSGFVQLTLIKALLPPHAFDAYTAAFRLPEIVNHLVAGGALSITFIPIFTHLREADAGDGTRDGSRQAWKFFSTIATIMGLALLLLVAVCVIFAEPLVAASSPGLLEPSKARTFSLAVEMTRVMLPAQLFFYLGGMVVGVLNAHKRFGAAGYTGLVYNLSAIAFGFLAWKWMGAAGWAWGILIGAACGLLVLPLWASLSGPREERVRYSPSLDWRMPEVRRFYVNVLPIALGVSLPVVDQVIVGFFASSLPTGQLGNLYLGNRFMLAPLGIVAQAASVAAFPFLASDSAARDWTSFSEFLRFGLRRLLFLTLPLSVSLILIAQPLLSLFRYGQFGSTDSQQVAVAFAFYCVGLFAWAGQQLSARGFYALQDTRTPTIIGSLLALLFFVPLCAFVVRQGWGVAGLAMATSIGAGAQFVAVTIALDRRLRRKAYNAPLKLERVLGTMFRTGAACAVMAVAGLLVDALLLQVLAGTPGGTSGAGKGGQFARLIIVSIVAWSAFVFAAARFRIPEWFWLREKILKKARR
jgi:putative peptidoglycan lipid II flippase